MSSVLSGSGYCDGSPHCEFTASHYTHLIIVMFESNVMATVAPGYLSSAGLSPQVQQQQQQCNKMDAGGGSTVEFEEDSYWESSSKLVSLLHCLGFTIRW